MKTKVYIVASSNTESTKVFTNHLFAQDYRDELTQKGEAVELKEQEIEITVCVVTYASHAREEYDDNLHTDAPQVFFSKSEALKEYEGMKNYAEVTAANDYDDAGDGKKYDPETNEEVNDDETERTFTAVRCENPLSIYTGRVGFYKF